MVSTQQKAKHSSVVVQNGNQINEASLAERWAREDLWADVAGEEIDENVSFDIDVFDDFLAEDHQYND